MRGFEEDPRLVNSHIINELEIVHQLSHCSLIRVEVDRWVEVSYEVLHI